MVTSLGFAALEIITIAQTNIAQVISGAPIYTTEFEFYCPSTNAGSVYLGGADVTSTSSKYVPRASNSKTDFLILDKSGEPSQFDFSKLYVAGTAGDTIVIQYRTRT